MERVLKVKKKCSKNKKKISQQNTITDTKSSHHW